MSQLFASRWKVLDCTTPHMSWNFAKVAHSPCHASALALSTGSTNLSKVLFSSDIASASIAVPATRESDESFTFRSQIPALLHALKSQLICLLPLFGPNLWLTRLVYVYLTRLPSLHDSMPARNCDFWEAQQGAEPLRKLSPADQKLTYNRILVLEIYISCWCEKEIMQKCACCCHIYEK